MQINWCSISLLVVLLVFSCTTNRQDEQTPVAGTKEKQPQTEPQSEQKTKAMQEAEQEQVKKYDAVLIGNQIWMANNLDVSYFRNGDKIPHAATSAEWEKAAENESPAWCYYNNDEVNGEKYGKLYNWYAVNDTRGLPPKGWIIPSNKDWKNLERHIGGFTLHAKKLMSIEWDEGSNTTGFNALPAGGCFSNGNFEGLNEYAYFWSSDNDKNQYDETDRAYSLTLMAFSDLSMISSYPKKYGFSVRAIKLK